jgi:hypothetical protein
MLKLPIVASLGKKMYSAPLSVGHGPGTSCALARHVVPFSSAEMQA